MSLPSINLEDFDFVLPKEKIAEYPANRREESKLLFVDSRTNHIEHHKFSEISKLIPENSFLVLNSTKVIAARLNLLKHTGGKIELLLIEPKSPETDPQLALACKSPVYWECFYGGRGVKVGTKLSLEYHPIQTLNKEGEVKEDNPTQTLPASREGFKNVNELLSSSPSPCGEGFRVRSELKFPTKQGFKNSNEDNPTQTLPTREGLKNVNELLSSSLSPIGEGFRVGSELKPSLLAGRVWVGSELTAEIIEKDGNKVLVKFEWNNPEYSFAKILELAGKIPLPPYIKRSTEDIDSLRYQTVYAKSEGSIAAPTAGLHFTEEIFDDLRKKGIGIEELILHVGPGTFLPIDADKIENHIMHKEAIFVTRKSIQNILNAISAGKRIIATGTTSVRTLESMYWWGVKLILDQNLINSLELLVLQYEPYQYSLQSQNIDPQKSFTKILEWMKLNDSEILTGKTQLFIVPGYDYKIIKGMITNFHLPKSTLILLVATFLGKELWKESYQTALDNNYRFLSYGDATLLLK